MTVVYFPSAHQLPWAYQIPEPCTKWSNVAQRLAALRLVDLGQWAYRKRATKASVHIIAISLFCYINNVQPTAYNSLHNTSFAFLASQSALTSAVRAKGKSPGRGVSCTLPQNNRPSLHHYSFPQCTALPETTGVQCVWNRSGHG